MTERRGKKWTPKNLFVVHRDMQEALQGYKPGVKIFEPVFEKREELYKEGEPYWNTDHDVEMKQTARERSARPGFKYPDVKRRNGKTKSR